MIQNTVISSATNPLIECQGLLNGNTPALTPRTQPEEFGCGRAFEALAPIIYAQSLTSQHESLKPLVAGWGRWTWLRESWKSRRAKKGRHGDANICDERIWK